MPKRKQTVVAVALALTGQTALAQLEAELNLVDLNGTNGFVINGVNAGDSSGWSVSQAGDVNGDGIDDLIIGAPNADPGGNGYAGSIYVVFGSESPISSPFELSSINGSNGFVINGVNTDDLSGNSVSQAGDVNGDGIDDLIIGALRADPSGNNDAGSSYVVFGSESLISSPFELSSINGRNGFVINGVNEFDLSGWSVSQAGDVNGDGIDDLIIGAPNADPGGNGYAGSIYVVFGSASLISSPFNLSNINGSNGFVINGVDFADQSGSSVSQAGDVNGDGIDDVIIGASGANPGGNRTGSSYVVFGSASLMPNPFNLSSINGSNGFTINGVNSYDRSGRSVSSAGDVNGDGIDDLIVGAWAADPGGNTNAGSSYVVFGSESLISSPFELSSINGSNGFVINGVNAIDYSGWSVSQAGDVNGDGIDDVIIGAKYADPDGNTNAGSSYVVFGSDSLIPNPFNLSSINGSNGFVINGVNADDLSGRSVSQAGDVNGDGIDDVIIGALYADPGGNSDAGSSYVVFGSDLIFTNGFE